MHPTDTDLVPGSLWQHWKGGLYRIDALATLEAGVEPALVYRPLSDMSGRRWIRPVADFLELVEGRDGATRPRFVPIPQPDASALRAAAAATGVPADVVEATLARYREPHRYYHAAWHVQDVFARAQARGIALTRAQVLALLFHDAVYVAGAPAGVNEQLSALLLRQALHERGEVAAHEVDAACAMVLDTAGHRPSVEGALEVIALDLATLADPPDCFDAWTELVWLEFRQLFAGEADPKRAFRQRRARVLAQLLESTRDLRLGAGWADRVSDNLARARRLKDVDRG